MAEHEPIPELQSLLYTWDQWREEVQRRADLHKRALELYAEWVSSRELRREEDD